MFENESNKIREDVVILQQLLDADEEDNEAWDIYQTERKLNIVLDHIDFLQRNLPYDLMTDDIEDEVVECDRLIEIATDLVEQCKYKYYLNNSFSGTTSFLNLPQRLRISLRRKGILQENLLKHLSSPFSFWSYSLVWFINVFNTIFCVYL